MTRLTDGQRTVEITMNEWTGSGYTPDWSNDFFVTGSLPYNAESDAYEVKDVDYCVEQAMDWKKGIGDFYDADVTDVDLDNRSVDVEEIA